MSKYNLKTNKFDYSDEIDYEMLNKLKLSEKNVSNTNLTNKNYNLDNYNIRLCSDEQTNIFFGAINNSTYKSYESIIRLDDLSENLDIGNFFKIICSCFESKPNYLCRYEVKSDSIIFYFTVCFDGFFQITQNICLMEKTYNQDKQLSLKIIELESRIKELESKEIILGFNTQSYGKFIKIKTDVETIDFRQWNSFSFKWFGNIWELNNFVQLKNIVIINLEIITIFFKIEILKTLLQIIVLVQTMRVVLLFLKNNK